MPFLPTLDTFTIPQGIEALGGVIHEIDYRSVRGVTWRLLPQHIQHAIDRLAQLLVVNICIWFSPLNSNNLPAIHEIMV